MFRVYASVLALFLTPNLISSRGTRDVEDWEDYGSPPRRSFHNRRLFRDDTSTFGYDDPQSWGDSYPECNGLYQSPINIDLDKLEYRQIRRAFKWRNLEKVPSRMKMEKSAVVMEFLPEWKNSRDIPYISGGPLNESYYFYNFHFHWDLDSNSGSEHAVSGKRFPMEMHAVYTSNPEGIITRNDRILVTAFMVTVSDNYNPGFEPVISAASKRGPSSGRSSYVQPFPLKQVGLNFCTDYVIYSGSLTTPPCTEGVTWIISSQPMNLSREQYRQMKRSLEESEGYSRSNNRPLQRLHGRKVFYVVPPPCPPSRRALSARTLSPLTEMIKLRLQSS